MPFKCQKVEAKLRPSTQPTMRLSWTFWSRIRHVLSLGTLFANYSKGKKKDYEIRMDNEAYIVAGIVDVHYELLVSRESKSDDTSATLLYCSIATENSCLTSRR